MAYLTQSEIETAFGATELVDLADRDGDGVADAAVVADAIRRADGIINSHLQSRYAVPLAETPELVTEIALALVRYILAEDHATERMANDRKDALRWLAEIRDGKMDIGVAPIAGPKGPDSGGARTEGGGGPFDQDALDAFGGLA